MFEIELFRRSLHFEVHGGRNQQDTGSQKARVTYKGNSSFTVLFLFKHGKHQYYASNSYSKSLVFAPKATSCQMLAWIEPVKRLFSSDLQ